MFYKKFRGKLTIAFGFVLVLALFNAAISYWSAEQSRFQLERSRLAHEVLSLHQQLSIKTLKLFKQASDMIVLGESADVFDEVEARKRLDETLRRLRESIAAEIAFVSQAERRQEEEELSNVDLIEATTSQILAEFQEVERLVDMAEEQLAIRKLSDVLDNSIDDEFNALVSQAIAQEHLEKEKAYKTADQALARIEHVASVGALLSVLLVVTAFTTVTRELRRPLSDLVAGTRELSAGNLSYRIEPMDDLDFREVAEGFNQMAASLQATARMQADMNSNLEALVCERTEKLHAANAALASRDEERVKFLADLSHELRTPLTIIRGEADVALRRSARRNSGNRLALERVAQQAALLSRLVDDLLFMARSESGHPWIESQPVDLVLLLQSVCDSVGVLAAEKEISIAMSEPAGEVIVNGDVDRLRQLFTILLDNAVRYGQKGGRAVVSIGPTAETTMVRVSDDGIGIPARDLERIFDRFYRGENAVAISPHGTGLGLSLALAIVDAHGGKISIESDEGAGTRVEVTLPAVLAYSLPDAASSDRGRYQGR